MTECPCKDCIDREINCHANCPLYKKYVVALKIDKDKEKEARKRDSYGVYRGVYRKKGYYES